jgi:DNA-binding transcriptional regulator YiaG
MDAVDAEEEAYDEDNALDSNRVVNARTGNHLTEPEFDFYLRITLAHVAKPDTESMSAFSTPTLGYEDT